MLSITRCNSTKLQGTEGFAQIPRKSVLHRCNCPRECVNLTSDIRNSDGSHTPLCRLRLGCFNLNQLPARKQRSRNASQAAVRTVRSFWLGRMTSRNYRTAANSPSGTIADTDTFTFDRSGRMLSAVSGRYTNTVAYTFDPAGRRQTTEVHLKTNAPSVNDGPPER